MDIDQPEVQRGEVRIKTHAFGLNKIESYYRNGDYGAFDPRQVLGVEAAGEVVEDRSGRFSPGQKVVTSMGGMMFGRQGSYAEYVTANAASVLPIDSEISFVELAALPVAYATVWGALDVSTNVKPGDSVLVRGATSSVGIAAITFAKYRGYRVIATTRNSASVQKLYDLGADSVIVDTGTIHEDVRKTETDGVDYALEVVGVGTLRDTLKSVRPFGAVVVVGLLSGPPIIESFHLMEDLPNAVQLSFFSVGVVGTPVLPIEEFPLDDIAQKIHDGHLTSTVAKIFKIEDIQEAHRLLDAGSASGKIIVEL